MRRITLDQSLLIFALGLAMLAAGTSIAPVLQSEAQARMRPGQAEGELSDAGAELFRNLGCVTCHVHHGVAGETGVMSFVGVPDLTDYRSDPGFLRRWLANPAAVRPGTQMPNLGLSEEEIEILVAFLSAP